MMWKVFAILIFSVTCMLWMWVWKGRPTSIWEGSGRGTDVCCVGQNGVSCDFETIKSTSLLLKQYIENGELNFSAKLVEKLVDDLPDQNFLISPIGIYRVLTLLYGGAIGQTKVELEVALGLPPNSNVSASCLRQIVDNISRSLLSGKRWNFNLVIASAIFLQEGFHFNDQFRNRIIAENSDLDLRNLDFSRSESIDDVDEWIFKKSRKQTHPQFHRETLISDPVFLLTNVFYFDAVWAYRFDRQNNKRAFFTIKPGTHSIEVEMMQNIKRVPFHRSTIKGYTAIGLPYAEKSFYMYFVQPDDANRPLATLVRDLTSPELGYMMRKSLQIGWRCVDYEIPRIKVSWRGNLDEQLKNLGIRSALKNESANFGNIFEKEHVRLSALTHATDMMISEDGIVPNTRWPTHFSGSEYSCGNDVPNYFVLNRPFLVILYHGTTNTILAYGAVHNPLG